MLRQVLFLLIACSATSFVNAGDGMYCRLINADNFITDLTNNCTPKLYGDKTYCCHNYESDSYYCCNAQEYIATGFGNILAVVIGVAVVLTVLSVCCCCLCCACCPWYKRRHRGTVYGIQGPTVQVNQIQPPAPNNQPRHTAYAYPANQTAINYPPGQPYPEAPSTYYVKPSAPIPNYAQ